MSENVTSTNLSLKNNFSFSFYNMFKLPASHEALLLERNQEERAGSGKLNLNRVDVQGMEFNRAHTCCSSLISVIYSCCCLGSSHNRPQKAYKTWSARRFISFFLKFLFFTFRECGTFSNSVMKFLGINNLNEILE